MEGPQLATNKITAGVLDAALLVIISAGAVCASGAACYAYIIQRYIIPRHSSTRTLPPYSLLPTSGNLLDSIVIALS